jgi:hypothetical protein
VGRLVDDGRFWFLNRFANHGLARVEKVERGGLRVESGNLEG